MWHRDPLVHFLLIGAALFAFLAWRSSDRGDPQRIVISAERVRAASEAARLVQGREPTQAELEQLVEPLIREEVYYREALALGLDVDDDEVRRRLADKMAYVTQDLADPEPASESELEEFFANAPERFQIPALVTFEQVFFSPSQRGEALAGDVATGLERLRNGAAPADVGDRTPLPDRFDDAARERIEVLFGPTLTDAVFTLAPGAWTGPFESGFGLHVVRVLDRSEPRQPTFAEVRAQAADVFAADRRNAANAAAFEAMRARYDIVVEWPEPAPPANAQ
ncbi:MAG TPA: peptidylprolyl isomerase [Gammaproteobacteria bacterium]|jgi:hypothetical protein